MGIASDLPRAIERVLLTAPEIDQLVGDLAARIDHDYRGRQPLLLGVLTGAVVFVADLIRRLQTPLELDFISVSSYGEATVRQETLVWHKRPTRPLAGRDLLIVEDIVDTGETLADLLAWCRAQKAASVACCALFNKPARRRVAVEVDYLGCDIPDEFVVGYGLDHAQHYRNLPYLGVLKTESG